VRTSAWRTRGDADVKANPASRGKRGFDQKRPGRRGCPHLFSSTRQYDQRFGFDIFQVEAKLITGVRWVERRSRGCGRGDGEKDGDDFDAVRQGQCHPLAASKAERL